MSYYLIFYILDKNLDLDGGFYDELDGRLDGGFAGGLDGDMALWWT